MDRSRSNDVWAVGNRYDPYIGRWSRRIAPEFLDWIAVAPGRDWLDVGCGTGALSECILERVNPNSVRGVDPSAEFVGHAAAALASARARFETGDARSLPLDDASVDAAVSALVLNFVPDPPRAAGEMARVTRPGGVVATYLWDYAERMELIRRFWDAAIALDPAAIEFDEARRFPLCAPGPIESLLRNAGLRDVAVRAIEVPTVFRDFDDFWSPFLGGQGPAPGYLMSLDEDRRLELRERIREELPVAADGSIALVARAWAGRGRKG